MKNVYDRPQLKLDFFQSEIDEVKVFFESKYGQGKWNGTMNRNTKGRAKEKLDYKNRIVEEALRRNAEKQIEELDIPIELLKKGKRNFIIQIINDSSDKKKKMSMSDKVKGLNAIKTELLEPTSIGKTDATIKGEPLDESLLIRN